MTDPPKVTSLPLTGEQRLRAKRAQRRQGLRPKTQATLEGLGQASGVLGIPKSFYLGAGAATAAWALLNKGGDSHEWIAAGVLILLGLI